MHLHPPQFLQLRKKKLQAETVFHQHLLGTVIELVDIQYSELSWEFDAHTLQPRSDVISRGG